MTSSGNSENWEVRVARKKVAVESGLPNSWKLPSKAFETGVPPISFFKGSSPLYDSDFFTKEDLDITENYSATELVELMATGKLSATQVTLAFCKRAAVSQQLVSCLTETLFPEAQERAQFLDRYFEKEKKTIGPLHGLPISIKDSFNIRGIQATIGFISFLDRPLPTENSPLIKILLQAGAVLYVKTNIPMTLMTADSHNNIFGRTLNPYNIKMTAGGSSGGEGALVALRGSVLGVGTDIAGSIRIPSLCCGTYGFKPSASRIPYGGQAAPSLPGLPGIEASAGPLANSIADIELFLSTVLNAKPWLYDSTAHAVHWRNLPDLKEFERLIIGVLPEDEKFPLHPPIRRALKEAVEALKTAGHTIIYLPSTPETSVDLANSMAWQYFGMDPLNTAMNHISSSGEPAVPSVEKTGRLIQSHIKPILLGDIAEQNTRRAEYKKAWLDIFVLNNLDVVIGPGAQNTAVPHDTFGFAPYTTFWNILDYPACIIPYSKVSKSVDLPFKITPPAIGPDFDPDELNGLPCAIQIAAPHFYDEELLRAVKAVVKILDR